MEHDLSSHQDNVDDDTEVKIGCCSLSTPGPHYPQCNLTRRFGFVMQIVANVALLVPTSSSFARPRGRVSTI